MKGALIDEHGTFTETLSPFMKGTTLRETPKKHLGSLRKTPKPRKKNLSLVHPSIRPTRANDANDADDTADAADAADDADVADDADADDADDADADDNDDDDLTHRTNVS